MNQFIKKSAADCDGVFNLIGKQWMLITAASSTEKGEDNVNTMTASWGGLGVLWNRPVAFCFIRPQRYTDRFVAQSSCFSLSFLPEQYRESLLLCGRTSGRDTDKFRAAGLTCEKEDGIPYVGESSLVLLCKKLYSGKFEKSGFCVSELLDNYTAGDFHHIYVGEICQILQRQL